MPKGGWLSCRSIWGSKYKSGVLKKYKKEGNNLEI